MRAPVWSSRKARLPLHRTNKSRSNWEDIRYFKAVRGNIDVTTNLV
jgi:hypothetical protein